MNSLLNYPGAKWGMAKEIVALMPPHRSYLEPFFGSGAVLFNKPPSAIETVNDIDGDITNFFKVLREQPEKLAAFIAMTPYSRDVFNDAHESQGSSDFERAYKFAIRSKMGHGFKTYQKTGFKIDVYARERSYCLSCWNRLPADLLEAAQRLKAVQIENQPALDLIRKFNHDNVLIYADPPYLLNTRGGKQYRHEMTEQDHVELLDALKQHKGSVILSGYPSEMYDRELAGWSRIARKSYNQNADQRTSVGKIHTSVNPGLSGRETQFITNAESERFQRNRADGEQVSDERCEERKPSRNGRDVPNTDNGSWDVRRNGELSAVESVGGFRNVFRGRAPEYGGGEWWATEPDVGRVAHGVPSRVDRLKCLGNAVVPQQFYPVFDAIATIERSAAWT